MKITIKRLWICALICACVWFCSVIRDRRTLDEALIRLHAIANSDPQEDQRFKLEAKDAILNSMRQSLSQVTDVETAKAYLRESLPKLQRSCNAVLDRAGAAQAASKAGSFREGMKALIPESSVELQFSVLDWLREVKAGMCSDS